MKQERKGKIKKIIIVTIHVLYLLFLAISIAAVFYMKKNFAKETLEEMIFYINNGVENSDFSVLYDALNECFLSILLLFSFLIILNYNILISKNLTISFKTSKLFCKKDKSDGSKAIKLYPIDFICNHRIVFSIFMGIFVLLFAFFAFGGFKYLKDNFTYSEFIEENYNAVDDSKIVMLEKKNLIYIYLESFETTFFSKEHGGDWDYEVMPEMYDLLMDKDSICFSCSDDSVGMDELKSASWTTAAIVANSTALPFKIPIDGNSYHSKNFMNGAYALGDILKNKGYYNEVISSAKTSFGGLKEFFTKHGDYHIIDIDNLEENNFSIKKSNLGGWGFNDQCLFNIAKHRLEKISDEHENFNLALISIDTHFPDGYKGNYTLDTYDTQYENVYATESKLVYDFIKWVKSQDFYKDTVIVIVGDHLSMQAGYFDDNNPAKRKIYNVIINASSNEDIKTGRKYTAIDMLPTTLAAMGARIYRDQIGLGVNLFSTKKTLNEKYGIKKLNSKLELNSDFYNNVILGKDYKKMIKEIEEE